MSEKTLIVFFNLKEHVTDIDYLKWAKESDLPTVNSLQSVKSFEVFKGEGVFGTEDISPWQYFEVIRITSESEFISDIESEAMQKIIGQFQSFTQDATFVVSKNIKQISN